MRKLILVLTLSFTGLMSAKNVTKNKIVKLKSKTQNESFIVSSKYRIGKSLKTSPFESVIDSDIKPLYKYIYAMGAVDTANGTCFTYGLYICLDDESFCTFTPHNTGGTVPTTCLGEGTYQA